MSTASVSGDNIAPYTSDSPIPYDNNFKENNFFINQIINNVYIKSKFEAEKLIIYELNNGLNTYIFRIGNLMGR